LQLTQAPRQPTLQQKPSVQKPDAQSPSFAQTAPRGLSPQLPLTQVTPLTQSRSERQVTTQAFVAGSQPYGAQIVAGPALQRPPPSQTLIPLTAAFSHAPPLHTVPATCLRQAPAPSQVPSRPQVVASDWGQSVGSRGSLPAGTLLQIPRDPCTSQARQLSLHEVLQQTPSAQKPLWQSLLHAHVSPFGRAAPAPARQLTEILSSEPSPAASGRLFDEPPQAAAASASSNATPAIGASDHLNERPPRTRRTWGASGRSQAEKRVGRQPDDNNGN
jgi:hypothetical protein